MITVGMEALATVDLVIAQGADNAYQFRYSVATTEGTEPVDLTDWEARMQIRRRLGSEVLLELASGAGITLGEDGSVLLTISHAVTSTPRWAAQSPTDGVYDLELLTPEGGVLRFLQGRVRVSPDVTRSAT